MGLEDAEDLAPGDALDERNAMLVTEQDADLRRLLALLRGLGDQFVHLRTSQTHASASHITY
jgi:hypothetical protein